MKEYEKNHRLTQMDTDNKIPIILFMIFVFFLLTSALNAEEAVNLSLEECIELGIKNNFEVKCD